MDKTTKALLLLSILFLNGCLGQIWTGANLVYDRHNLYKKMNDYELSAQANHLIFKDTRFKCPTCIVDITAFNDDLLMAGHVPTLAMKEELERRVAHLPSYRHIYNKVSVSHQPPQTLEDAWITMQIRTQVLADSTIDPQPFKVATTDRIVYLMGEVRSSEARRIIQIAAETHGVLKVVKLFKYYTLT